MLGLLGWCVAFDADAFIPSREVMLILDRAVLQAIADPEVFGVVEELLKQILRSRDDFLVLGLAGSTGRPFNWSFGSRSAFASAYVEARSLR